MSVIIHDTCPNGSYHPSVVFRNNAPVGSSRTEIFVIKFQFRLLCDLFCGRFNTFRNKDRLVQEILQKAVFTFSYLS